MHLSDLTDQLQEMNGILSYRLAVNDKSETYVLFIKWADLLIHDDFKYTDAFKKYLTHDALKRFPMKNHYSVTIYQVKLIIVWMIMNLTQKKKNNLVINQLVLLLFYILI